MNNPHARFSPEWIALERAISSRKEKPDPEVHFRVVPGVEYLEILNALEQAQGAYNATHYINLDRDRVSAGQLKNAITNARAEIIRLKGVIESARHATDCSSWECVCECSACGADEHAWCEEPSACVKGKCDCFKSQAAQTGDIVNTNI